MLERFQPVDVAIDASHASFDAVGALLRERQLGGRRVSFVIDDALVRLWQVSPPVNALRPADLEAAAALRFQALYGEAPVLWRIAAAYDAVHPFMAAAMPQALLAAVLDAAAAAQVTVVAICPRFIAAWNRHCRALAGDSWLAQVHDGVLTLGAGDGGRLALVRAAPVPPDAGHAWLATHVAREAARLNRPAPARLALCGAAPRAWTTGAAAPHCQLLAGSAA